MEILIFCTNRHQHCDQSVPVLLHWPEVTTPTLGGITYTHLKKAPKALHTGRLMAHWEHGVGRPHRITRRGHIAQMFSSSSNQETRNGKQEKGQAQKGPPISRLYLHFEIEHCQHPFQQGFSFFSVVPTALAIAKLWLGEGTSTLKPWHSL